MSTVAVSAGVAVTRASSRSAASSSASAPASWSAPRLTAAAGLLSSCATPAVSVPSCAIFSDCRNIDPVARQRASTV